MAAAQGKERPMARKASAAHQIASLGAPRANLRLARGPGAAPQKPHLARGLGAPLGEFPPRSRDPAPRMKLRLARGRPRPVVPYLPPPPDGGIKCSDTSRAPGSKVNPHHAGPLTPPGDQIPTLFNQPALCVHPWRCAGAVREGQCHSITLCRPLLYLLHVAPLEKRMAIPSKGVRPPTPRPPRTTS
jgi:hypothetical protein